MSLGKYQPSLYSSKAFPSFNSHNRGSDNDLDVKAPILNPISNGIARHHGKIAHHGKIGFKNHLNGKLDDSEDDDYEEEEEEGDIAVSDADLKKYIHIKLHPNGGASTVHIYQNEIDSLGPTEKERVAYLFFEEVFSEEPTCAAKHVIGIVHDAVKYMPEIVKHMSTFRPDLDVKV